MQPGILRALILNNLRGQARQSERQHSTVRNMLRGASTVLALLPAPRLHHPGSSIPSRSASEAIAGDWALLGDDMRAAIQQVGAEADAERTGARDGTSATSGRR